MHACRSTLEDPTQNSLRVYVASVYDGKDYEADMRRAFFERKALWSVSGPLKAKGAPAAADAPPPYTEVCVTLADYANANAARDRIRKHVNQWVRDHDARAAGSDPDADVTGLEMITWQDQRAPLLKAVATERALLAIVIAFIGLLAGFTILATLTLTVVEKTRDIGVLMALGGTSGGVMSVFLFSGMLTGILGGIFGCALGIALSESLNPINSALKSWFNVDLFPADIYMFDKIPCVYDWTAISFIVFGCMLVAFLAGLLPSLRAARMDPIVALRHE